MLDKLEIPTPPGESQVSRPDKQMGIILGEQGSDLRVEDAMIYGGDRLDFIVASNAASALFAQSGSNAFGIRENESVAPPSPEQGIEQDGLEKGKAQRISCKSNPRPRCRRDKFKWIHEYPRKGA